MTIVQVRWRRQTNSSNQAGSRRRIFGWAGWTAVTAVATAIGSVGTLGGVLLAGDKEQQQSPGHGPSGPASTVLAPTTAVPAPIGTSTIDGACNFTGNGLSAGGDISIECVAPLPKSLANVTLKLGGVLNALFLGPAAKLPRPDRFRGYEARPFCHWWGEWPTVVPNLYLLNPEFDIEVEAGESELVSIREIWTDIYSRVPMGAQHTPGPSTTLVDCSIGGGSNVGNIIEVDTTVPRVTLSSGEWESGPESWTKAPMPPASLSAGDVEHQGAVVTVSSREGYMYEGSFRVVARVNGEDKIIHIGSRQQPLKWITDKEEKVRNAGYAMVGWDPDARRWVADADIYAN